MQRIIIGIDEVGRGPLAGPVMVGAVAGIADHVLVGIRDSKKLTPKQRDKWCRTLLEAEGAHHVIGVDNRDIDRHGIRAALNAAVRDLLAYMCNTHLGVEQHAVEVLLDGSLYAPAAYRQRTIIRGDEKHPLIAAASIIAKVRRDRYMIRYDVRYPAYGFARHKGYGTAAHIAAIRKHGLTPIHRKTFCRKILRTPTQK